MWFGRLVPIFERSWRLCISDQEIKNKHTYHIEHPEDGGSESFRKLVPINPEDSNLFPRHKNAQLHCCFIFAPRATVILRPSKTPTQFVAVSIWAKSGRLWAQYPSPYSTKDKKACPHNFNFLYTVVSWSSVAHIAYDIFICLQRSLSRILKTGYLAIHLSMLGLYRMF